MARILVLYKTPKDPAAFDAYYFGTHIPLAKTIPGLKKYEVNHGPIGTPAGPAPYHLIATLYFDDMAAIQYAFASPEGQATGADVQNFAPNEGDAQILLFDDQVV